MIYGRSEAVQLARMLCMSMRSSKSDRSEARSFANMLQMGGLGEVHVKASSRMSSAPCSVLAISLCTCAPSSTPKFAA